MKYDMPHKRWCHFLFRDGMARSNCVNSLWAKNQEVWEWKDCISYSRHINYNTLACCDFLKMYCICPQLAFSFKCSIVPFILFLSFFPERPCSTAQSETQLSMQGSAAAYCLAELWAGWAEQFSPHRFKTAPLTFSFYSSFMRPGQKSSLDIWKQQMRIPEIEVFIFHGERIYISMYKMKRLY